MKIAILSSWNVDNGAATHAKPIVYALKDMGHDVQVFSFYKSEFEDYECIGKD